MEDVPLLPVVVQDDESELVLMIVFMSPKAFDETKRTGWLTLYSRKSKALRVQGADRDCRLVVRQLVVGCEGNCLLAKVIPEYRETQNKVCHHGAPSCFQERVWILDSQLTAVNGRLLGTKSHET